MSTGRGGLRLSRPYRFSNFSRTWFPGVNLVKRRQILTGSTSGSSVLCCHLPNEALPFLLPRRTTGLETPGFLPFIAGTILDKRLNNQGFPDGVYSCLGVRLILVKKEF